MNNDLLEEFEQQFSTTTAEITSKIYRLLSNDFTLEDKESLLRKLECLLNDSNELLEQMELEVRDAPLNKREILKNRVTSYESELKRLKKEYERALRSINLKKEGRERQELLGDEETEGPSASYFSGNEQKQRLLDNTETLERSSVRLMNSYKAALESEEIGAQVLNDLQHQRNTLNRARNRLHDADDELDQSSRVLNVMLKRFTQNKFILTIVFITVAITIFIVIYIKFIR